MDTARPIPWTRYSPLRAQLAYKHKQPEELCSRDSQTSNSMPRSKRRSSRTHIWKGASNSGESIRNCARACTPCVAGVIEMSCCRSPHVSAVALPTVPASINLPLAEHSFSSLRLGLNRRYPEPRAALATKLADVLWTKKMAGRSRPAIFMHKSNILTSGFD